MHELSIVLGIVDISEKEAKKAGVSSIESIELEIGTLAGIEFDALEFVWPAAVKNTVLEHAKKKIEIVKGKGQCMDCDLEFELENIYDSCPECDSHLKGIIKGKELRVKALTVA